MASAATIQMMARQLPPECTDLSTAVSRAHKSQGSIFVSVIGYVVDMMEPSHTRGTSMQMTFTLCDKSTLTNGLRVKYFKDRIGDFPSIRAIGDIVLLRHLKVNSYRGEVMGLSSYQTQHVVFPKDLIVSPHYRDRYAVHKEFLSHSKSSGAADPDTHEQQWVISLNAYATGSSETRPPPIPAPDTAPGPTQPSNEQAPHLPAIAPAPSRRDKFSLIKNVHGGDRNGGNPTGNFYDLAGEAVKLFFNISLGVLEFYITDYTVNSMLPDHKLNGLDDYGQSSWKGPSGKMTLHIEMRPPHATWAHQNIKEGDFVFIRNVRVKWNQRLIGNELEANLWADGKFPDRVGVSRLSETHPQYSEIQARKTSYLTNTGIKDPKVTGRRRKKKDKRNTKRQKCSPSAVSLKGQDYRAPEQSDHDHDSDVDEPPQQTEPNGEGKVDEPMQSDDLNPSVKCLFPDVPLSPLNVVEDNPYRWFTSSTGEDCQAPFINVRHRVRVHVTDYYPHELKDFTRWVPKANRQDQGSWQWHFWLVLRDGESNEVDSPTINVLVDGDYAEDLLQIIPSDLSHNPKRLQELEQTLFLLWGELEEQKTKFIHSHPQIGPDLAFSAVKYNIKTNNRAFDTCIEESGMPVPDQAGDEAAKDWRRTFTMFGTRIKR